MRLLIDTHVALWAITDDPRLSLEARGLLLAPGTRISVSSASVWEIAIKRALGKGDIPMGPHDAVEAFRKSGFDELAISSAHARRVFALPPIHADPFDRMLVAQALEEPLVLVTHDPKVAAYSDTIRLV